MAGRDLWFGPNQLPEPREEYVAWLDLMGTGGLMEWSPKTSTTNVGKLVIATIEANKFDNMEFYPVMDGVYFTNDDDGELEAVFWDIFLRFADVLLHNFEEEEIQNVHLSPILRAGIAFGDDYHGIDFEETQISGHPFSESLLSGKPVAGAHRAESEAPPFGIKLAPSITEDNDGELVEWWQTDQYGKRMREALHGYLDFYEGRESPDYPDDKIQDHRQQVDEYFPESGQSLIP